MCIRDSIYYISKTVDKGVVTMAISVLVSFVSLGATLSPLVINGLQVLVWGAESDVYKRQSSGGATRRGGRGACAP